MDIKLKPCPFCGGEAEYHGECNMVWVRCTNCHAERIYKFDEPEEAAEDWNRRTQPEGRALAVDELRQMDMEPVYLQLGDGTEVWAICEWETECCVMFHFPNEVFEADLDFINMEYDDPDGHFGLHLLGWRAYRHKPEGRATHETHK